MNASKRQSLLISAALVFLVLLAFEPVRHNAFVEFDDNQYLMENTHLRSGFTTASIAWAFTSGYASNWHPLTWLSHMVDIRLFGLNPLGHHLHNILLHALSTVLLFLILKSTTGAIWRSAFVAMLFGVHPLHVESVAWAAERKDVLCAVFWMLTIAAYVNYVRRGGIRRYLLVTVCLALGLMAKPMLVSLPLVLLVLDYWPLKRVSGVRYQVSGGSAKCQASRERRDASDLTPDTSHLTPFTRLIAEKIPLFMLVAASCVVTYLVQQQGKSVALELPFPFRIANALNSYIAYLGKLVWPSDLGALYPYPVKWPLWKPAVAALLLVLTSALVRSRAARQPWLTTGWLWYLVSLIPVIGLVQVGAQSMADRYTYLPAIGIFMMIAWGAASLSAGWQYQKATLATAGALVAIALVAMTRAQVGYWKDSVTLFEHTVAVTRDNYTMHHSLGWALAKENRFDEAAFHLGRSLQLRPDPETHLDMANVLIKRGQFDEALIHLRQVLHAEPTNAIAHYDLGIICQAQGKTDEAIKAYEQSVQFDREYSSAFNNLGILKTQKGSFAEAAECFRQSLRIDPDKAATHRNLASVLQMQEQLGEAVVHYRTALRLDPTDEESSWSLAFTLHGLGQLREAADYDRYTLRLNPDHARALNDLAWILATTPDREIQNPSEAIRLAQRAAALTRSKEADILDTLATAYASAKQFDEAVETAQQAIHTAKAAGQDELAREIELRLQLFQSSKPFLEPLLPLAASK